MSKFKDSTVPKANPYLLKELHKKVDDYKRAKEEYKALKDFYDKSPEERKEILAEREKQKTENSELTVKEKTEKEIEEKPDTSLLGKVKFFVMGADHEPIVEKAVEIAENIKESVTPNIFKTGDACENKDLILAERKLIAKRFEAKQMFKQLKKRLNPFNKIGTEINLYDETELGFDVTIKERSAQEAMQLLATVYTFAKEIGTESNDPDLLKDVENLHNVLALGSSLDKECFASICLSDEVLSDKELAKRWGLNNIGGFNDALALAQGDLPQMYFQVQKMLSAYNVLQTVVGVEKVAELEINEIESREITPSYSYADRQADKETIIKKLIEEKITSKEGIQEATRKYIDGAAISTPLEFSEYGELTLEQGTVLRLLIAKTKFEVSNELEEEMAYRLKDNYENFVGEGRIANEINKITGKNAEELSELEVNKLLKHYSRDESYTEMKGLLVKIKSNLPAFVELRRSVEKFNSNMSYEELKDELSKSRKELNRIIEETLQLTPEKSVELAEAFVSANEGNLSAEAKAVPARIKQFVGNVFSGDLL